MLLLQAAVVSCTYALLLLQLLLLLPLPLVVLCGAGVRRWETFWELLRRPRRHRVPLLLRS